MKNKFTSLLIVALLLSQSLWAQRGVPGRFQLDQISTQDPDAGAMTRIQSIQGAMAWRGALLADENGNVDPTYSLQAIMQANQMQRNPSQRSASLLWQELGPGNVGGRTRSILYDHRDSTRHTLYAGAVGGGIWKSTDGGDHWLQLSSVSSCLAISCIAQDANGLIYFGTGEGLAQPTGTSRNTGTVGNGLHTLDSADQDHILTSTIPASISNGVKWCMINRIAINPNNPLDIYVATSGGGTVGNGLQHTTDGGQTWTLVGSAAAPIAGLSAGYEGAADVKFSSDGAFIFASVGSLYQGITPNGATVYYPGIKLIESTDTGHTWTYITPADFPQYPSSVERIEIGVAPSDPYTLYIAVVNGVGDLGGIYKSADAGSSWTLIGSAGGTLNQVFGKDDQGAYDDVIAVNPGDADKVYFGGTQLYSYTSQSGWTLASLYFGDPSQSQWVHPDMHAIVFDDKNKDEMFVGCDGGIFKSEDAYSSFPTPHYTVKNRNYAVTQNYSVAADRTGSVLGGAQDNGTNYIDYLNGATTYATNVYGGDGVYAEISHFDPRIFIGGYVSGQDFRSANKGANWFSMFDAVINPGSTVDPLAADNNDPSICGQAYGGNAPFVTAFWLIESQSAYNSIDSVAFTDTVAHQVGDVITLSSRIKQPFQVTLTSPIAANETVKFVDPLKANLYFATACGLWMTPDILDFANTPRWFRITASTDDVKSLAATPTGDTIYFGGNSKMTRMVGMNSILAFDTATKGHSDILLSSGSRFADTTVAVTTAGRFLEGIDVDINDPTHVICAIAGYSSAGTPHVYQSSNSGNSWTPVTGTLPNMPVYQCVIDAYNSSHYIIGSELGIWDSYDRGATWAEENDGINARVPVYRLRQQGYLSDQCYSLYIGTHGRGMWRSTTLTTASGCSVDPLGISTATAEINNLLVYPNPVSGASGRVVIDLEKASPVTLRVIDMPGRLMTETSYSNLPAGRNELALNTSGLASGTYLVVSTLASGETMTRTFVVAK